MRKTMRETRRVRKAKSVRILVDESFYKRIENARQSFMRKNGLNKLTTVAFTGILDKNLNQTLGVKNAKKQKRRR